ncbi:MAG: aldo/keto reductase [Hyphomicrobiales bacterium]|nr:aldo/keto reductase [Hyphomicrobiales bacterium]
MKTRTLGSLNVSAIGLGCMSMTQIYGEPNEAEAIATIHRALELGVTLIDTADAYNGGANEELVGRALKGRRDKAILSTKFGNIRLPGGGNAVDGRPEHVQQACEASLARLGIDTIDLYFVHRIDSNVPIEDTVGAMSKLVDQGKVRHIGLSEAGPATIRRAQNTHPLTAIQTEYSLWSRDPEAELLPLCEELGIGYVAYSPMGRGFLTGAIESVDSLGEKDRRREHPRFKQENIAKNTALVAMLKRLAGQENCTPAQLAIAWLLSRRDFVVPIPGTKQRRWLEENIHAVDMSLAPETLSALEDAFPPGVTAGTRYPEGQMKRLGI